MSPPPSVTALVLCGGGSRRMAPDGSDKTAAVLGPTTVLDHLLDALAADWPVVVVGPERPTSRRVRWTREAPIGGGPVAAVAAGLVLVDTELVVVLAGDMPFAATAATRLAATLQDTRTDAVVATDPEGRPNPLLAVYRTTALNSALPHPPADAAARSLLAVAHTTVPVDEAESHDVDTPEALALARAMALGD